jgi:hypothetical protein
MTKPSLCARQRTDSQGGQVTDSVMLHPDYQPGRVFIFAVLNLCIFYRHLLAIASKGPFHHPVVVDIWVVV